MADDKENEISLPPSGTPNVLVVDPKSIEKYFQAGKHQYVRVKLKGKEKEAQSSMRIQMSTFTSRPVDCSIYPKSGTSFITHFVVNCKKPNNAYSLFSLYQKNANSIENGKKNEFITLT